LAWQTSIVKHPLLVKNRLGGLQKVWWFCFSYLGGGLLIGIFGSSTPPCPCELYRKQTRFSFQTVFWIRLIPGSLGHALKEILIYYWGGVYYSDPATLKGPPLVEPRKCSETKEFIIKTDKFFNPVWVFFFCFVKPASEPKRDL
jgi:hypothetical protein